MCLFVVVVHIASLSLTPPPIQENDFPLKTEENLNSLKKYIFFYLSELGLSCNMRTFTLHGIWFSDQGSNLGPLLWEHGVLVTGPPGNSQEFELLGAGIIFSPAFRP